MLVNGFSFVLRLCWKRFSLLKLKIVHTFRHFIVVELQISSMLSVRLSTLHSVQFRHANIYIILIRPYQAKKQEFANLLHTYILI